MRFSCLASFERPRTFSFEEEENRNEEMDRFTIGACDVPVAVRVR